MASNAKSMIFAVCVFVMALCVVKGYPASSAPSLMTQYLREICSFYIKEKGFPGISGCNNDVIEEVKEHGDNIQRPGQYIPNWNGDNIEVYLNMAKRSNFVCTAHGAPVKGACAAMEAVCTSNENVMPCAMVTAALPTTSPTVPATTPPASTIATTTSFPTTTDANTTTTA